MRRLGISLQHMQASLSSESANSVVRALYNFGHQLRDWPAVNGKDRQSANFLRSLEVAEREAFASVAVERLFRRHSRLMSEGEPANYVMVILSGWTEVTVRRSGNQRIIAERGPGQLVGERAALRRSIRSATVTALTDVVALVMRTEDFASFISAHPRVLEVVEDQIYGRLTEDPEGYAAADGWPGGFPLQVAIDALSVRDRAQPLALALAGENCTVILTDIVGFGGRHRTDRHRMIVRRENLEMTQAALGPLWDACLHEDRGDGLLIVAPPSIPTARIMEGIHRELPARVRAHNSTYTEPAHIRLRVAVNVGPVTTDPLGMSGEAIIRTARLVEAPALKTAMETSAHGLGIIVSEFVYETAVGHADPVVGADRYQRVEVTLKEFQSPAWMRLYDQSPLSIDPLPATSPATEPR
jgi:hypothetical protein